MSANVSESGIPPKPSGLQIQRLPIPLADGLPGAPPFDFAQGRLMSRPTEIAALDSPSRFASHDSRFLSPRSRARRWRRPGPWCHSRRGCRSRCRRYRWRRSRRCSRCSRWTWCWSRSSAGAWQRVNVCTAAACPDRKRSATPVYLHIPYHRVRQTVFEALPHWSCQGYVVGIVNAPVSAGIDLLRNIGVNNDRVHWDVRQIARLVRPCEGIAGVSTAYLENVPWRSWRICVKAANRRVPDSQIRGEIDRDAKDGAVWQNGIIASDIYPDACA